MLYGIASHALRFWLLVALALAADQVIADHPNIIIIYADDLGYGDLSCYNAEAAYKTPRLDQMAAEGARWRGMAAERTQRHAKPPQGAH